MNSLTLWLYRIVISHYKIPPPPTACPGRMEKVFSINQEYLKSCLHCRFYNVLFTRQETEMSAIFSIFSVSKIKWHFHLSAIFLLIHVRDILYKCFFLKLFVCDILAIFLSWYLYHFYLMTCQPSL